MLSEARARVAYPLVEVDVSVFFWLGSKGVFHKNRDVPGMGDLVVFDMTVVFGILKAITVDGRMDRVVNAGTSNRNIVRVVHAPDTTIIVVDYIVEVVIVITGSILVVDTVGMCTFIVELVIFDSIVVTIH